MSTQTWGGVMGVKNGIKTAVNLAPRSEGKSARFLSWVPGAQHGRLTEDTQQMFVK